MNKTFNISIVIPVFNSNRTLPELLERLTQVLSGLCREYEIILVDDGSRDNSWEVIRALKTKWDVIKGVQLMKNSGQANATLCGLKCCRHEVVITMDDDLQHLPEQIPVLVNALRDHPDMDCVYGVFEEKKHAWYRNLGSGIISRIERHTFNLSQKIKTSGFRVMRRDLVEQICRIKTMNPSLAVLILSCTHNILSLSIPHGQRHSGKSNYNLRKQFRLALDHICTSSVLPLRFITFTGISLCLMSLLMVGYFVIRYFLGTIGVRGWTSLVVLISFFSGILLLSMGIFGEYLVRVLREVGQIPPYIVRRTTDND